jgi:hypothetical protein
MGGGLGRKTKGMDNDPALEDSLRRYIDGLITEEYFTDTLVFEMLYNTYPFYKKQPFGS